MTFEQLNIDPSICQALNILDYKEVLPVQETVIPEMLKGRDCIVKSKTGSGKTASFAIPILQSIEINEKLPQALVLAPTRELSFQIKEEIDAIGIYKKVKTLSITGKQPFVFQKEDLAQRCHVVIGTPGRILDHLQQGTLNASMIQYVILDEADEMLNMNFIDEIRAIFKYLSKQRITCIFSATYPKAIQKLSSDFLNHAKVIEMQSQKNEIEEIFYECKEKDKTVFLLKILCSFKPKSCIIFCGTQQRVEDVYAYLSSKHISVNRLHGGMLQEERFSCMNAFKQGNTRLLVATDVAARGIDIEKVDLVINYDMPSPVELYIHRIGRSGRINEKGTAISLTNEYDGVRKEKLEAYLHREIEYSLSNSIWNMKITDADLFLLSKNERKNESKKDIVRKDVMKLYLNGGKNKKIRPGDIVGAICEIEGVNADDIGVIQVQDHQSYVDILNNKGKLVLNELQNKTIKGKKLRIQKAKD